MASQAMLDQARAALHALMTGSSLQEIRHEGQGLMRYTPANAGELRRYINQLEGDLGLPLTAWSPGVRLAARRVLF